MALDLSVLLLAAGKGTRMHSQKAKVLHEIAGIPLAAHPIHVAQALSPSRIVLVVGHQAEAVQASLDARFGSHTLFYALQTEQKGTGHAVIAARELLTEGPSQVLILSGDVPLLSEATLRRMLDAKKALGVALVLLTFVTPQPKGYGRILRSSTQAITAIREDRDCTPDERSIQECNAGIYLVDRDFLLSALSQIAPQNDQKEYYLTDILEIAVREGRRTEGIIVEDAVEVMGVNDRSQLADLEARWQEERKRSLMRSGVTFVLPQTTYLSFDTTIGPDTEIGPNVGLYGKTTLGRGCCIGAGSYLKDILLPPYTVLPPYSRLSR